MLIPNQHFKPECLIKFGVLLSIIAIFIWWVANGLDTTFYDNIDQETPTGGGIHQKLHGSVDGYKVD